MKNNLMSDFQFNANQFHFHQASEHTIDGQRFDFEMHIVNFPNQALNGVIASAFAIIFDTKNYDKSIS
jgi:carbonic anhydrase